MKSILNNTEINKESIDIFFNLDEWSNIFFTPNPDALFLSKMCQLSKKIRSLLYEFIVLSNSIDDKWIKLFYNDLFINLYKLDFSVYRLNDSINKKAIDYSCFRIKKGKLKVINLVHLHNHDYILHKNYSMKQGCSHLNIRYIKKENNSIYIFKEWYFMANALIDRLEIQFIKNKIKNNNTI